MGKFSICLIAGCLLLVLAACGGGSDSATGQTGPQGELATQGAQESAPLLVWRNAPDITVVDPATGATEAADVQPRSSLAQVLERPHLLLGRTMLGDDFGTYALPAGFPAPSGLWHAHCQDGALHVRASNSTETLLSTPINSTPVSSTPSTSCPLSWSPDGRHLAFIGLDGLQVVTLDAEAVAAGEDLAVRSLTDPSTESEGISALLAWSPDGQQLIGQSEESVIRFSLNGEPDGEATLLALEANRVQELHWSPDGEALWLRYGRGNFVRATNADRPQLVPISRYDLESDSLTEIVAAGRRSGPLRFAVSPQGTLLAVWYADCRQVWSDLMPVRVLECTTQIRLVPVADPAAWIGVGDPVVSRNPGAPNMRWADWQPPAQLLSLPVSPEDSEQITPELSQQDPQERANAAPASSAHYQFGDPSQPGNTPQSPIPFGDTVEEGDLSYQVVDVLAGTDARTLISAASQNATILSPLPGTEHVAVKLRVTHPQNGTVELGVTFFPRLLSASGSAVPHLFLIDAESETEQMTFRREGEVEVWLPFLAPVAQDGNASRQLLLPQSFTTRQPIFLAARPDAALAADLPGERAPVNNAGLVDAAQADETVVTDDWQIEVVSVQRFAASPEPGRVTVGVEMALVYQGGEDMTCAGPDVQPQPPGETLIMNGTMRSSMSSLPRVCYLPGGRHQGWLLFSVPAGAESLLFSALSDPTDGTERRLLEIPIPE